MYTTYVIYNELQLSEDFTYLDTFCWPAGQWGLDNWGCTVTVPGGWNLISKRWGSYLTDCTQFTFGGNRKSSVDNNEPALFFSCVLVIPKWRKSEVPMLSIAVVMQCPYLIIIRRWWCFIMNVWYRSGVCSALILSCVACQSLSPTLWGLLT